jgi:hypothetical protein
MVLDTSVETATISSVLDEDGQKVRLATSNKPAVYTEEYAVSGTTEETPTAQAVPRGKPVLVVAHPGNSGVGCVGGAEGDGAALPLPPAAAATFKVRNTDALRVKGAGSGDRFIIAVEVDV